MRTRVNASFTVEAAIVMPLVLYTILALIFLSFNLHDRCRIHCMADKVLHKASIYMKHDADITTCKTDYENINDRGILYPITGNTADERIEIEQYLISELEYGLLCTEITGIEVKAGKLMVRLEIQGRLDVPATLFMSFLKRSIHVRAERPLHNPAEAIRISEVILETGTRIKGVDKLIEKLESLIPNPTGR